MRKKPLYLFILGAFCLQLDIVISNTLATPTTMQHFYGDIVGKTAIKAGNGVIGHVVKVEVTNDLTYFLLDNGQKIKANDNTVTYNLLNPDFKFNGSIGQFIWLREDTEIYPDELLSDSKGTQAQKSVLQIKQIKFNASGEPFIETNDGFISGTANYTVINHPENFTLKAPEYLITKQELNSYRNISLAQPAQVIPKATVLSVASLELADNGTPVFKLNDGRFISADKAFTQKISSNYLNYWCKSTPFVVNLLENVPIFSSLNAKNTTELLAKGDVAHIKAIEFDETGIPKFRTTDDKFITASKDFAAINADYADYFLSNPQMLLIKTQLNCYSDAELSQKAGIQTKGSAVEITKLIINKDGLPVFQTANGTYLSAKKRSFKTIDDLKIYRVQALLNGKYNQANLGIYVQRTTGGDIAQINAQMNVHAASTGKLPEIYYTQKLLNQGKLKMTDKWQYTSEVNQWQGAYLASGSGVIGELPTNRYYTVEDVLQKTCYYSDNAGANLLGYYATERYNSDFKKTINHIVGTQWDVAVKQTNAEKNAKMMLALYKLGGISLDYLSNTAYDNARISRDINLRVAHKIGDAYDYRHDVGIIYAEEPFVLSIVTTDNTDYATISQIADDILAIMQ
ncbi:MAG: serine hydrolase [Streptococcaceae bacterium]|jgi:beta-lactamase class C|nr:serine hydrolase [Streptococcaceae bacterium]